MLVPLPVWTLTLFPGFSPYAGKTNLCVTPKRAASCRTQPAIFMVVVPPLRITMYSWFRPAFVPGSGPVGTGS